MLFRIRCLFVFLALTPLGFVSLAQPPVEDLGRRSQTMLARIAVSSPSLAADWNEEGIRVLDVEGRVTIWDPVLGHPVRSRRMVPSRRPAPTSANEAAVRAGEPIDSAEEDSLLRAYGFEGQRLALALDGFATSWDLDTLERLERYELPEEALTAIAIDREGQWLASGDEEGRLCLWPVVQEEGERRCIALPEEYGAITALDFVGEGRLAVGQVRRVTVGEVSEGVWSGEGSTMAEAPEGSQLQVLIEAGDQLVIGWSAGRIDTVGLEGGEVDSTNLGSELVEIAASRQGDRLAVRGGDGISILSRGASSWERANQLLDDASGVRALAFDPTGSQLAMADDDGLVTTWAVASGRQLEQMKAHGRKVGSVRWASPQELWTVVPSRPAVYAWKVPENLATVQVDGERLAATGRGVPSTAVASPDGGRVAIAFADGGLALWDRRALLSEGDPVAVWEAHEGVVAAVAFATVSANGDIVLLTAGSDGAVRWWQAGDGAAFEAPGGASAWEFPTPVFHLGLSPFERVLALGTDQGIAVRDLETGEETATATLGQPIFASRFVRQDELVLAAGDGLYSWRLGAEPEKFQDFGRGVGVFDFAPASRELASAKALNGAVEIWTFEDDGRLTPIHLLLSGDRGLWIACEKDGTCRRNDDGTLLLDRERDEVYKWTLPALGTTPVLEVVEASRQQSDDVVTFEVTLRNQGPGPAPWVRLRPSQPHDAAHFTTSDTLPWLDEGAQTTLKAEVGPLPKGEAVEVAVEAIAATASARDGVVVAVPITEKSARLRLSAVLGVLLVLMGWLGFRRR